MHFRCGWTLAGALCALVVLAPHAAAQQIADSVTDWSGVGEQGAASWYYGYYNYTLDLDATYSTDEFNEFVNLAGPGGGPP